MNGIVNNFSLAHDKPTPEMHFDHLEMQMDHFLQTKTEDEDQKAKEIQDMLIEMN